MAIENLGDSVEGVENLLKTHADFESKLHAQEDRLKAFSDSADKLIKVKHEQSDYIDRRRAEVLQRRRNVYALAAQRKAKLEAALVYQNLKRQADELSAWIGDKKRIASDDSYKDPNGLDRKLLKHEAFMAELNANAAQLHAINDRGEKLIGQKHHESPNIARILKNLNSEWDALVRLAKERGDKLKQADDRKVIMKMIDDANLKLDDIERQLAANEPSNDLR